MLEKFMLELDARAVNSTRNELICWEVAYNKRMKAKWKAFSATCIKPRFIVFTWRQSVGS